MVKDTVKLVLGVSVCLAAGFLVGFLIGWFGKPAEVDSPSNSADSPSSSTSITNDEIDRHKDFLVDEVDATKIGANLRRMTLEPHLAGTEDNKALAEELIRNWDSFGFETKLIEYEVLLSYPGEGAGRWNQAFMYDGTTQIIASAEKEKILDPEQDNPKVVPPFNAFTKGANVTSDRLVYANYGRREDFDALVAANVQITGSIAIIRYGEIYRGNKVKFAQIYGAVGVILYSDPKDYAIDGKDSPEETFPNSWWLPPTGVQRGSTKLGDGDPETPLYPSRDFSYREDIDDVRAKNVIPDIPSQPIGYGDAYLFLREMTGVEVPDKWKGGLNMTYKYGGNLAAGRTVAIRNNNVERRSPAYNAVGVMKGAVEPDRYVMLGNHRDAWVFGAVDPTSGTATMLEVSRALYRLYQTGWRPRRSIVFCSWGAEEYGLIGSTEWVEEYIQNLKQRSVIYVNVDIAVVYNYVIRMAGSALIKEHIKKVAALVPDPDETYSNLHEGWMAKDNASFPGLGSGSDHAPFFALAGITAVDVSYTYNKQLWKISGYPVYHSVYETFDLVNRLTDVGFLRHQAVGRFTALLLQTIADSNVIPFNVNDMAAQIETMQNDFLHYNEQKLRNNGMTTKIEFFRRAVSSFKTVAAAFMERVRAVDTSNVYAVRMVNDQLMYLERALIDPMGLPDRPNYKNMIFAPSSENSYGAAGFAGVVDTIAFAERAQPADEVEAWATVDREFSKVISILESLGSTLSDVSVFYRI